MVTVEQLQVLAEVINRAPTTLAERVVIAQFFKAIEEEMPEPDTETAPESSEAD